MTTLNSRNDWVFGKCKKNVLDDKDALIKDAIIKMLNISTQMFEYKNLPETIRAKDVELQLQVGGYAIWNVVKDNLYTFTGGLGGDLNAYYLPTIATVANPALNFSKSLKINDDCVVMLNDNFYQGLMPMFNKYASLLIEAELTLKYAILNARIPYLIEADNDKTYKSALDFLSKLTSGKEYGVIANGEFFEGIKTYEFYKEPHTMDIIESIQYIRGTWFNEIGLNASYNMKREAINSAEVALNDDILRPTVDNMLENRQYALDKVNKMYGTNITVDFSSVWKQNKREDEISLELKKSEVCDENL